MTEVERPKRIYFGWRIVGALSLCLASLVGVAISSFVMFSAPLSAEFGWSAAQTGSLVSAMWLVAPLTLVMAPLVERMGPWRLLIAGMLIEVAVLVALGAISTFWQLFGLRLLMGVGKILIMTSAPVIVARWFQRRFATTMAIVWSGAAAGQIVMSPLTEYLASSVGWRSTALILATGFLVATALVALLARGPSFPSDARVAPEARAAEFPSDQGATVTSKPGWLATIKSLNWFVGAAMCIAVVGCGVATIAFQAQAPAFFDVTHISPAAAALLLSVFAAAALIGSILAGWMLDRFTQTLNSLCVTSAILGGLAALSFVRDGEILIAAIAAGALGYGFGAGEVLWITLFKRQFGTPAFATTYGLFYLSYQIGLGVGGGIGGLLLEGYGPPGFLILLAAAYVPAALLSLWRPAKPAEEWIRV